VILQLLLDGPEEGQQGIRAGAGGKLALLELVEGLDGPCPLLRFLCGLPFLMEDRLGSPGSG
jgi:hypothetical protein